MRSAFAAGLLVVVGSSCCQSTFALVVPQPTTVTRTPVWGARSKESSSAERLQSARQSAYSRASTTRHRQPFLQRRTNLHANPSDDSSEHKPIRLIIAGAPASGKGTQCEKIKTKYGLVHLSTGDMLREAVAAGTPVGKLAKEYMDSGRLVPDDVIIGVIKDRLEQEDCQTKGWLLDGFPRTQAQAKALEECGAVADCFIFLNVPDEILVERVVGRRTDPETGAIYHMTFSPPEGDDIILRLVQRSDDTEEKVKVRLEQFHANVGAVSASYEAISVTINGHQSPEVVTEAIFEAIETMINKVVAA